MGYPTPLKTISRKLSDNVVITSAPFTRFNTLNFGARMALLNFGDDIIVWSALPYGEEVEKAIALLKSGNSKAEITHLIIPDQEHTMAAASFKTKYPSLKIIAPDTVDLGQETPIDYKVSSNSGNKILSKANNLLEKELGIKENSPLNHLEFVYLPTHTNRELVVFDAKSKILFEADLMFNFDKKPFEQFSPALGFPEDYNPFTGISKICSFMNANSWFGRFVANKALGDANVAKLGITAIQSWDYKTIVMCHGNVIDEGAKEFLQNLFSKTLK